jgi:hypothetical protein
MSDMRGRAPASAHQKAIAAATIAKTKPWQKATGPRTAEGKARSAGRHHKWEWSANVAQNDAAYIDRMLEPRLRFFRDHLKSLGLLPQIRAVEALFSYEGYYWHIRIKLKCLESQAAILERDCPGWLTPKPPNATLLRLSEGIPAIVAEEAAAVKVESQAARI